MANQIEDPFHYYELAEEILVVINDVFASNEVSLPERQYVAVGPENTVAYDCEQLTVTFKNVADGLAFNDVPRMLSCNDYNSGLFFVELVRCIPTVSGKATGLKLSAPTAESLNSHAKSMLRDAKLFREVVTIVDKLNSTIGNPMYSISFGEPSGAYQSVQLSIKKAGL